MTERSGGRSPRPSGETQRRRPEDATASRTDVRPGDDVVAVLSRVGDGSTVTFAPGSYEVSETIVVDVSLELIGSGRDNTTITSSAAGLVLAFVGPGDLVVRDITLRHTGDDAASVLLAVEGAVTLQRLEISGAVTSSDRTEAGHGIVFGFEDLPNLPQRTAGQRAGALLVEDVSVTGNEGAGVLVSGDAAPRISASTISGNGTCGICFVDEASGSVTGTTIEDNGGIGIQIVDSSNPTIEHTTLRTHGIAVLLSDSPVATMTANNLEGNQVGIQVGGTARLDAVDNVIDAAEKAGITFADSSTGIVRGNRITGRRRSASTCPAPRRRRSMATRSRAPGVSASASSTRRPDEPASTRSWGATSGSKSEARRHLRSAATKCVTARLPGCCSPNKAAVW